MPPLHSFAAPRSSAGRDTKSLKTPEPLAEQDVQPSPPRPRFRLRKRTASHLNAPTQNFLASVAAADVPIPSIEEPQVLDEDMIDTTYPAIVPFYPAELYAQPKRGRPYSPPRTPAPNAAPALSPTRFPDWSLDSPISSRDSSPDYESSRPSTAVSTQTSSSIFSRFSLASEDLSQCVSPEVDQSERFSRFLSVDDADRTIRISASTRARRAPWTRAMSQHLWATYMTYLQDPKVTPFRIGKSGIPPHGVCMRVAREARRSWRRFKPQSKDSLKLSESVVTLAWPHTCAATRAHLRDLCKANAGSAARDSRYLAHSPTPFGRTAGRYRNRRSAPLASPSVFSGSDMAMSLVVSTAESMQPNGPLAQLTRSQPEQARQSGISTAAALSEMINAEPSQAALRSPFVAKSYGPSSSNTLQDVFGIGPDQPRQTHTTGPRRLASPARLTESRPGSQKRRPAFLENRTRKRPSLASDFWTNPVHADVGSGSRLAEFSSTTSSKRDALFVPRTNLQELFETSRSMHTLGQNSNQQISGSLDAPTRLGSPFPGISSSKSLPNRFSSPARLDPGEGSGKPFATVQQAVERGTDKTTLQSRLACLDKHLRDFRRQDGQDRRSKSPRK